MGVALTTMVARLQAQVPVRNGVPADYSQLVKDAVAQLSADAPIVTSTTLAIVAGTATYTLPTDFLFQIALERARQRKEKGAGGILHFHAIDIWPSVTMAAIDFDRRPTKVWDTVRRSFAPVAASFAYEQDQWKTGQQMRCGVWAINDSWEALTDTRVVWRIEDGKGVAVLQGEWQTQWKADSAVALGDVKWKAGAAGLYRLVAQVVGAGGKVISENVFEFTVVA